MFFGDLLGPRQEDETFVVFYDGDLARSTREKLPPVRGRAFESKIAHARAKHPDAEFGWYAYRPDRTEDSSGRLVHRHADPLVD